MLGVGKTVCAFLFVVLMGCASKPKVETPSLTPQEASALLQYDNKAHNWIMYVKKQNPVCDYKLDLPDQSNQPAEISLDHIVTCGSRPSPKEFDASVVFVYDKAQGRWVVQRFAS